MLVLSLLVLSLSMLLRDTDAGAAVDVVAPITDGGFGRCWYWTLTLLIPSHTDAGC
jgi:hypothetical protein